MGEVGERSETEEGDLVSLTNFGSPGVCWVALRKMKIGRGAGLLHPTCKGGSGSSVILLGISSIFK